MPDKPVIFATVYHLRLYVFRYIVEICVRETGLAVSSRLLPGLAIAYVQLLPKDAGKCWCGVPVSHVTKIVKTVKGVAMLVQTNSSMITKTRSELSIGDGYLKRSPK